VDSKLKADIIMDFAQRYSEVLLFEDFFDYNDLGIPLAVAVSAEICELNKRGHEVIDETYLLLLTELRLENINFDKEYEDLDDILEDSPVEEEVN
jgi:hypothetical protein